MSDITLHLGDCLEVLPTLPANSVDAIICDPPYGTTKCKWDSVIPLEAMWGELQRVVKPQGAIVIFCTQPFTSTLIASNIDHFKYCWTWDKKTAKGHLVAKIRPMQQTEDIAVFGQGRVNYYPIMTLKPAPEWNSEGRRTTIMGGERRKGTGHFSDAWYPKTLLHFPWSGGKSGHPTEKPVALIRYLIETYTRKGDSVLDFAMGSGSTAVACIQMNRNFMGCELDNHYFNLAQRRVEIAQQHAAKAQLAVAP